MPKDARERPGAADQPPRPESRAPLRKGHGQRLLKKAQDPAARRLNPARATGAAQRLRAHAAALPVPGAPPAPARRAHTNTPARRPVAHARTNRRSHAKAASLGQALSPSTPAASTRPTS